jgi:hypothetical protein
MRTWAAVLRIVPSAANPNTKLPILRLNAMRSHAGLPYSLNDFGMLYLRQPCKASLLFLNYLY